MSNDILLPYNNLEWATFEINLKFQEPAFFDEFIGGVIRNSLKYIFRNSFDSSSYKYLFETSPTKPIPEKNYSDIPRPYVLHVPYQAQTWIPTDGILQFRITLIGNGMAYISYFIDAFKKMGNKGIGLTKSRYTLIYVDSIGPCNERKTIYNIGDTSFSHHFYKNKLNEPNPHLFSIKNMVLTFLTPIRLICDKKLITSDIFSFEIFLYKLIDRLRSLAYFHDNMEWFEIDESLITKAKDIRSENHLHWQDVELYVHNSRQKIGGVVGEMCLEGKLSQLCYILDTAKWLNVGKHTTYGFGNIDYMGLV